MLEHPLNRWPAALAEHLPRDHPVPLSIPARAALKKESLMDETTFEVLALLALYVTAQLRRDFNEEHEPVLKALIADRILELERRMDKLRHELKGGT